MARIYGTNSGDLIQASDNGDIIYGWDKANAVGDEGPNTDADKLIGGSGDDRLFGGSGNDTLDGNYGSDFIDGGRGNDEIFFGDSTRNTGESTLVGGAGDDLLIMYFATIGEAVVHTFGEDGAGKVRGLTYSGFERLYFIGGGGDDYVIGSDRSDTLYGELGNDRLVGGNGADEIAGYTGADRLYGEAGNDRLSGEQGADALGGGDGRDRLIGDNGRDTLFGGEGGDRLIGGNGRDSLVGGEGADVFVFAEEGDDNFDIIEDFDGSEDRIFVDSFLLADVAKGKLRAAQFVVGPEAKDADDRVIYDSKTGRIWLDFDGSGEGQKILLAKIDVGLTVNAGDFLII